MERDIAAVLAHSRKVTKKYSSSIFYGIKLLKKEYRDAVYAIYAYISKTGTELQNRERNLRQEYIATERKRCHESIASGISDDLVLFGFQHIVNKYNIPKEYIDSYFHSLTMKLRKSSFSVEEFNRYIYGSAEVIALMFLSIFTKGYPEEFSKLKYYARKLGLGFLKVSLLRYIHRNNELLGFPLFPGVDISNFGTEDKKRLELDIRSDFREAYRGIGMLPSGIRLGIYTAFVLFRRLFGKIIKASPEKLLIGTIRLNKFEKSLITLKSIIFYPYFPQKFDMNESLDLKVEIDKDSGFCFGVVNAIEMAEKALQENEKVYCLGEIVHNDEETHRLEKMGLKTINKNEYSELKNGKVLFRAHGEPPKSYKIAEENEIELIDASCPIILKLQKRIKKSYDEGETILIYGKKNHPEIVGLNGQIDNKAIIFEKLDDLNIQDLDSSFTLYSQTTVDKDTLHTIAETLKEKGFEVKLVDTTCRQVSNRKSDLEIFCRRFDKVVFIAGRNSSNGKVLYQQCKAVNSETYFISSPFEIKRSWFSKGEMVGIAGATSTPGWVMEEVKGIVASF